MTGKEYTLPIDGNKRDVQTFSIGSTSFDLETGNLSYENISGKEQMLRIVAIVDTYLKCFSTTVGTVTNTGADVGALLPAGTKEYIPLKAGATIKVDNAGELNVTVVGASY